MTDRLLSFALNLTVTAMIALVIGGACALSYGGLTQLLVAHIDAGGIECICGSILALSGVILIKSRNDLIDR